MRGAGCGYRLSIQFKCPLGRSPFMHLSFFHLSWNFMANIYANMVNTRRLDNVLPIIPGYHWVVSERRRYVSIQLYYQERTFLDFVLKRRAPLSGFAIHRFMSAILAENSANKINRTHIYLTYSVVRFYVLKGEQQMVPLNCTKEEKES